MNENTDNDEYLQDAIRSYAMKQQIGKIHKEMMPRIKRSKPGLSVIRQIGRSSLKIAAGVLLLIVCGFFYLYVTISDKKLFDSHYISYASSVERGEQSVIAPAKIYFLQGQEDLKNGNTEKAVNEFNKTLEENRKSGKAILNDDAEYYLALSYLKSGDAKSAIQIFEMIHDRRDHLYNSQVSSWFILRLKILALKQ